MVRCGSNVSELKAIVHWAEIKTKFLHSLEKDNEFPAEGKDPEQSRSDRGVGSFQRMGSTATAQ